MCAYAWMCVHECVHVMICMGIIYNNIGKLFLHWTRLKSCKIVVYFSESHEEDWHDPSKATESVHHQQVRILVQSSAVTSLLILFLNLHILTEIRMKRCVVILKLIKYYKTLQFCWRKFSWKMGLKTIRANNCLPIFLEH